MTVMFCQKCHEVGECKVLGSVTWKRRTYLEQPYMNVYVRLRRCERCGKTFKTYEVGAASLEGLRKVANFVRVSSTAEQLSGIQRFIQEKWSRSKREWDEKHKRDIR